MNENWASGDLLLRQVHPKHRTNAGPNSLAFFPTPKDEDQLSVDDAHLKTARESWEHFTRVLGFASAGTWGVTVGEVEDVGDLELKKDPVTDQEPAEKNNPAHCLIDFSSLPTKGQKKKRAQQLAIRATKRGCQYPAVED